MGKEIGGKSNDTGFMIFDRKGVRVSTPSYTERSPEIEKLSKELSRLKRIHLLILVVSTLSIVIIWLRVISASIAIVIVTTLIIAIASLRGAIWLFEKRIKQLELKAMQWHALEHKVINLLKSGEEITLENLRKAPMITLSCSQFWRTPFNPFLAEPTKEQLMEGLKVALKYLELKKSPSFFEPILWVGKRKIGENCSPLKKL